MHYSILLLFHLLFFPMHLLFSIIILTEFHTSIDNNLKVVTIRIVAFYSGCILALLKAVGSPLKKILALNISNLLLGMRLRALGRKRLHVCNVLAT